MDVKGPISKYNEIAFGRICEMSQSGDEAIHKKVTQCIKFLKAQTQVDYMFRLTLFPTLDDDDMKQIAGIVRGAKCFQLQQFVPNEFSNSHKTVYLPYKKAGAENMAHPIKEAVETFIMRGF